MRVTALFHADTGGPADSREAGYSQGGGGVMESKWANRAAYLFLAAAYCFFFWHFFIRVPKPPGG